MNVTEKAHLPPQLCVEPEHLEFGAYRPENPLTNQPSLVVTVTNCGGGVLKGRVLAQVSWVILSQMEFECAAGQSVSFRVQMSTGAPQFFQRQEYRADPCLWIDTNCGLKSISASYHIGPVKNEKSQKPAMVFLWFIPILLAFILVGVFNLFPQHETQPASEHTPEEFLYTSGAQTVLARMTNTAGVHETEMKHQTPAIETTEAVFSLAEKSPIEGEVTFTPWARDAFLNPEQLVQSYFKEINARQYERAWAMLTEDFQQTCCAISGNDPFVIYSSWWNHNIDKVEVKSAFLQAWDQNPAPVLVSLSYYYTDGKIEDLVFMYYIVVDEERNTLLIDVVE